MYLRILLVAAFILFQTNFINAQGILDGIKKHVEKKVEKKVEEKIDKAIDESTKESDENKNDKQANEDKKDVKVDKGKQTEEQQEQVQNKILWNKYDFIPGDVVIFEDNLVGEKLGEFPSKWDLTIGNVEIANFNGENVIAFLKCNTNAGGAIIPMMKNNKQDYLPDEFTIEFDAYYPSTTNYYQMYLLDYKNQKNMEKAKSDLLRYFRFFQNYAEGHEVEKGFYPNTTAKDKTPLNGWRHYAISFNKRALKIYLDDARVINVPNLGYNPLGITLGFHNPTGGTLGYIKNVRIAKGAVPLYDKFITEGKIVTTGIKFDVNKATLKPESMGVINDIYKILAENPDIKFSIEGHTDSDGDNKANLKLSEERAKTVKNQLVTMGISEDRLKAKGLGESKPVDTNDTPEGKANNRRVEFVKF